MGGLKGENWRSWNLLRGQQIRLLLLEHQDFQEREVWITTLELPVRRKIDIVRRFME
jgi:hypothetical protein